MLARPDVTCCCAHEKSRNGTTQNDTASTVMCPQILSCLGSASRRISTNSPSASAPRMSRDHATCAGEMPSRATFMNRKLEPHTTPARVNWTAIESCDVPAAGASAGAVAVDVEAVDTRRLYARHPTRMTG